jgi:hypothetical protein
MERIQVNANTGLVALGGVAVGCAAGGGVAYLLCRKSFQSRLDSEVAEIKARYNDRLKTALSSALSVVPEAGVPFVGRPGHGLHLAGEGGDEDQGSSALGDADDADDGEYGELDASDLRVDSFTITDTLEGVEGGEEESEGDDERGDSDDSLEADAGRDGAVPDRDSPDAPVVDRDLRGPYVISLEEFVDPPPGWQQLTITYFAAGKDKVMVDERHEPIPNFHKIVGKLQGPQDFGGISGDPHIRYVRNQEMESDFEILLDARSYAEGILHYGQPNRES